MTWTVPTLVEICIGSLAEPLDEMVEADGAHWSAALGEEDVSLVRAFAVELA